jgi:hypothetical protein
MDITKFLYEGCLIWTLTTSGYKFFTLNLYKHLQAAKVPWKLAIVCADHPSYRFFQNEGIPCILYTKAQRESMGKLLLFGSKPFQEINLVKLDILNTFAKRPEIQTCVYFDGDIVVKSDFLPDIRSRLAETPLLFQCDEQEKTCKTPCKNCCTGFIAWKHEHDGGIFAVTDKATWTAAPEDQRWVNTQLQHLTVPYGTLPRELYPNGVFVESQPAGFLLLHYNWLVGNAKIMKMKKHGHWIIPYL